MPVPLTAHSATHPGLHHPKNEDSYAVLTTDEGGILLLVCDGMGGMGRGDEASKLAVEVITEAVLRGSGLPPDRLRSALREADQKIRDALCDDDFGLPGSTAVMVYVVDGAGHVAWVGDSRAYLVREGKVIDRTRDHKLVEELVDAGQLTPAEAKASAFAHVVTRALGGRAPGEPAVNAATLGYPWKLLTGDRILVCSDGVCDLVEDDEIPGLLDGGSDEDATARLVEISLARGGHDNITCVVATWEGPNWVEEDVSTPLMKAPRESSPPSFDGAEVSYEGLDNSGRVTEEIDLRGLTSEDGAVDLLRTPAPPAPAPVEPEAKPSTAFDDDVPTDPGPLDPSRATPAPQAPRPAATPEPPRPISAPLPAVAGDATPGPWLVVGGLLLVIAIVASAFVLGR